LPSEVLLPARSGADINTVMIHPFPSILASSACTYHRRESMCQERACHPSPRAPHPYFQQSSTVASSPEPDHQDSLQCRPYNAPRSHIRTFCSYFDQSRPLRPSSQFLHNVSFPRERQHSKSSFIILYPSSHNPLPLLPRKRGAVVTAVKNGREVPS
jgi:hypothetical protein